MAATTLGMVWGLTLLLAPALTTPTSAHEHKGHGGGCRDSRTLCAAWARAGACRVGYGARRVVSDCPLSCGACTSPYTSSNPHIYSSPYTSFHPRTSSIPHTSFHPRTSSIPHTSFHPRTSSNPTKGKIPKLNRPSPSPSVPPSASPSPSTAASIISPDFECGRGQVDTQPASDIRTASKEPLAPAPEAETPLDIGVSDITCGATPLTDRFLVTAAHCVLDPNNPVRVVRLGELEFGRNDEENSRPADYEIEAIYVSPNFLPNSTVRYNDIALLQTVENITFNEFVFPYCVMPQRPAPGTNVTGAGFGLVNATGRSPRLQEAEMEVVEAARCEDLYRQEGREAVLRLRYPNLLQDSDILCAAFPDRSACEGDSGGPLYLDQDDRRYLVGVVGSGVSCSGGASSLPGLYVSLANHIGFIDSVIYGRQE